MKILIAVDSFKGSMSSIEIANCIQKAIFAVEPKYEVQTLAVADGGEGTLDALLQNLKAQQVYLTANNALFEISKTQYAILQEQPLANTAVIEMAAIAGLGQVEVSKLNPLKASTFGLGELINDAITKGCRQFIIGLGGSATNDGGIGMLDALGFQFLDKHSNKLDPIGENLIKIVSIDISKANPLLSQCHFTIACDVQSPLYGKQGAAFVFAKQKGASNEDIQILDRGLRNFSDLIARDFSKDIANFYGAGAAGGLAAGFKAFLNSTFQPGIDIIFDILELEDRIKNADIVITGEGALDAQSLEGKLPIGIAHLAYKHHKIAIALAGSIRSVNAAYNKGLTAAFSILDGPKTLDEAMEQTEALIYKKTIALFKLIKALK